MAGIQETGSLSGSISAQCALSGNVSIAAAQAVAQYEGDYQVIPQAFEKTTLPTANKHLLKDITVTAVPYYEVSNTADGKTVYIASEV